MTFEPDPLVRPFKPDDELLARALSRMMREETMAHRFLRQRYEHASCALRVALDSLRDIYPTATGALPEESCNAIGYAMSLAEGAYVELDRIAEAIFGATVVGIMRGTITTEEELDVRLGTN